MISEQNPKYESQYWHWGKHIQAESCKTPTGIPWQMRPPVRTTQHLPLKQFCPRLKIKKVHKIHIKLNQKRWLLERTRFFSGTLKQLSSSKAWAQTAGLAKGHNWVLAQAGNDVQLPYTMWQPNFSICSPNFLNIFIFLK